MKLGLKASHTIISGVKGAQLLPAVPCGGITVPQRRHVAAPCRQLQLVRYKGDEGRREHGQHRNEEPVSHEVEKHVNEAAHEVKETVNGFLTSPKSQALGFAILAGLSAAAGTLAIFAPERVIHVLLQSPTDPAVNAMTRLAGAALLVTAMAQDALMVAALRGKLQDEAMKRLNAGLTIQSTLGLVLLAQAVSVRNTILLAVMGTCCGLGLLINGRTYALQKHSKLPLPDPKATLSGALSVLVPRNFEALVYSVLTVLTTLMAGEMMRSKPDAHMLMLVGRLGPLCVFARRLAGGALVTATLAFASLKDAADRGKLGQDMFRRLNLGCAVFLGVNAWNLLHCMRECLTTSGLLPPVLLGVQVLGAAFCALQFVQGEDREPRFPEIP